LRRICCSLPSVGIGPGGSELASSCLRAIFAGRLLGGHSSAWSFGKALSVLEERRAELAIGVGGYPAEGRWLRHRRKPKSSGGRRD
jgi:hypothetical protein